MWCPFDVGDVVVCVDDSACEGRIIKGKSYRLGSIVCDGLGVTLVGVDHKPREGFLARRFRKIDADVTEDFRHAMRSLKTRIPVSA